MAGYSVDDRVEVLWQGELFTADGNLNGTQRCEQLERSRTAKEVIEVPFPDAVDVQYEIDGSVGKDLTAEAHGLRLLPDRSPEAEIATNVVHVDADVSDDDEDEEEGGAKQAEVRLVDGYISVETARSMLAAQAQTVQPTNTAAFAAQAYMAQLFQLQVHAHGLSQAQAMRASNAAPIGNNPMHWSGFNSVRAPHTPPSSPPVHRIHPATRINR